jgi:hypothetical protein
VCFLLSLLDNSRLHPAARTREPFVENDRTDKFLQNSENADGESLIFGVSSMQGWRISMEDAHATVLDYAGEDGKATSTDKRLAFFGVYDGHGGDKVALYTGEQLHQIVAKQEAFKEGDIKKALQDGFLATDRAILSGKLLAALWLLTALTHANRSQVRGGSLWLHSFSRHPLKRQDLRGMLIRLPRSSTLAHKDRPMPVIRVPFSESRAGQSRCRSTTSPRTKVSSPI